VATIGIAATFFTADECVTKSELIEAVNEDVKEHGKALEGKVLSQAVQLFLNEQLVVADTKVLFRPGRLPA